MRESFAAFNESSKKIVEEIKTDLIEKMIELDNLINDTEKLLYQNKVVDGEVVTNFFETKRVALDLKLLIPNLNSLDLALQIQNNVKSCIVYLSSIKYKISNSKPIIDWDNWD